MSRGPDLASRLAGLREAVEAADGHLPLADLAEARALLAKAGARIALGDATVVALAGATGSGKSSLFNALAGQELSPAGVRRPTTGTAHACVWGDGSAATPLLDWLGVPRRHVQAVPDPGLAGLVLLDLPDHDSTRVEHRLEVDRLVGLVDVLVWVLDPQKYADAAVHDRYLAPYAGHAGVLLVVLNQADRLDDAARRACLADLRGLLDTEGLRAVPLQPVSARTGEGVAELRRELARRVAARRAASERLAADVRVVAGALADGCTASRRRREPDRRDLVDALAQAAGVPVVTGAVERSVRDRGTTATGWPPVRWVVRLRPDPLRGLRLSGPADERVRTSLGPPSEVAVARLDTAVRQLRDQAGQDLPQAWRDSLREAVEEHRTRLPDRLDRAVAGAQVDPATPRWWASVRLLQRLLLVVALVGAGWLVLLAVLGAVQLGDVLPLPHVGIVPVPTLLLAGGLVAGLLLAALCRPFVGLAARRSARGAGRRLRDGVEQVAQAELLVPVGEERAAYDRWCAALTRARA